MAQARIKALVKGIYAEVDGEFRPLEIGEEADVPTDFADRLAPNKAERIDAPSKQAAKTKPAPDPKPDPKPKDEEGGPKPKAKTAPEPDLDLPPLDGEDD